MEQMRFSLDWKSEGVTDDESCKRDDELVDLESYESKSLICKTPAK